MSGLSNTQYFKVKTEPEIQVGYIMSGDPTYITSFKGARSLIMKVERDELVEELLKEYIKNESWK